jgi:signal transduction histidine kinase
VLVGVLRLRCRPGGALSSDQVAFLNRISPEIALALVLAIAHTRQLDRVRIEAQLDERRRLSYDLHNSLAQHIGYLHLSLDRLASDSNIISSGNILSELKRLREVAGDAYEQVRASLSFLRAWQQVDLTQAIDEYACAIARRADLAIDLKTAGTPARLSPLACQHIFSLVQEGLCNVEKHARARRVEIALDWTVDDLRVSVSDDGVGFDPAVVSNGHYGLAMMAERLQRLGGERRIESAPGAGTRLHLCIPLRLLQGN